MKKYINIFLIIIMSFYLIGCEQINQDKMIKVKPPFNDSLSIKGIWEVVNYKVLDNIVYTQDTKAISVGDKIEIAPKYIKLQDIEYQNVSYKLKLVKDDYVISYEEKYTLKDLKLDQEKIEVITVINNNNIFFEFIKENDDNGFIFYNGALYQVKLIGKINENIEENKKKVDELDINKINNEYDDPVGIYLGIKSKYGNIDVSNVNKESYKTLYISFKNGKLQPIKEKNEIITPRMNGIWSINKKSVEVNNYHHEYFETKPIDSKIELKSEKNNTTNYQEKINQNEYKSINYVGNDYIATEVYRGENFTGDYNRYEVIPIDNITSNLPIVISDIFSNDANIIFKQTYEQIMSSLLKNEISKYSEYINYSNFSVKRNNGKWCIVAKISPAYNQEGEGYDYLLNIKQIKKLVNYDYLLIPWKTLKSEVPLAKDVFTSPNDRIALVVTDNNLIIYEIQNSRIIGNPLDIIEFDKNDEIIMSEWCIGDYVDSWEKPFLE